MKTTLKITAGLLAQVRSDLIRPHPFAHERVGFISAGLSSIGQDLLILARQYRPVDDGDYLDDPSVGAMMGPAAIRKALQWAMEHGHALLHVHTHGGHGIPGFSPVDLKENARFVPDFHKVAPCSPHGALVLSDTAARGQLWLDRNSASLEIDSFVEVGGSLTRWSPA